MKKIIKLYEGLVEWFKRLEREIVAEDVKTDGKFSTFILILLVALLIMCCVILAVIW